MLLHEDQHLQQFAQLIQLVLARLLGFLVRGLHAGMETGLQHGRQTGRLSKDGGLDALQCTGLATADAARFDQHAVAGIHLGLADAAFGTHAAASIDPRALDKARDHAAFATDDGGVGSAGFADDAALDRHIAAGDHFGRLDGAGDDNVATDVNGHAGADIALHIQRAVEVDIAGSQADFGHIDHLGDIDALVQKRRRTGHGRHQQVGIGRVRRHADQAAGERQVHDRTGRHRHAQHVLARQALPRRLAPHQRGTDADQHQHAHAAVVDRGGFVVIARRHRCFQHTGKTGRLAGGRRLAAGDHLAVATAGHQGCAQRIHLHTMYDAPGANGIAHFFRRDRLATGRRHDGQPGTHRVFGDADFADAVLHLADRGGDHALFGLAAIDEGFQRHIVQCRILPALSQQPVQHAVPVRRYRRWILDRLVTDQNLTALRLLLATKLKMDAHTVASCNFHSFCRSSDNASSHSSRLLIYGKPQHHWHE